MTPAFRPDSTLDRRDAWALINARNRAMLVERFGSLAAAERAWRAHREVVFADPRAGADPPGAWWLFESGHPELFDRPYLDPRLPEYAAFRREFDAARAAVLAAHPEAWRWPRDRRRFDPTRPRAGRKE